MRRATSSAFSLPSAATRSPPILAGRTLSKAAITVPLAKVASPAFCSSLIALLPL